MATRDWKMIRSDEWLNKKNGNKISIDLQIWTRFESPFYIILVTENGILRSYDGVIATKKDALQSVKSYMRKH